MCGCGLLFDKCVKWCFWKWQIDKKLGLVSSGLMFLFPWDLGSSDGENWRLLIDRRNNAWTLCQFTHFQQPWVLAGVSTQSAICLDTLRKEFAENVYSWNLLCLACLTWFTISVTNRKKICILLPFCYKTS